MGERSIANNWAGMLFCPPVHYNITMSLSFSDLLQRLYQLFIKSHSTGIDTRRREFILNTLLSGLFAVGLVALLLSAADYYLFHLGSHISTVVSTLLFWLVTAMLLLVSRRGWPQVAAVILVALLLATSLQFTLSWGFGLAIAQLMFALTIVVAGVLFAAPLSIATMVLVAVLLAAVAYLQAAQLQHPIPYWDRQPYQPEDVVGYVAVFAIIGITSWLSNRERDRSLKRARASEAALQRERDNLEVKVAERTRALEELQLARLLELQPFVEFGRIGASLVHEIANPLTAATLNLEELSRGQHSELVRQVQRNLHHLERYLIAARKQIKRESDLKLFSVSAELRQIVHLLDNRARQAAVVLDLHKVPNLKLYGDVVKFDQLVANILANAVDASEKVSDPVRRRVTVAVAARGKTVKITITDHGAGISDAAAEHLFEPFYSTKPLARSGLGIGLALVKQYVEHDFKGSITVSSSPAKGTTFTLRLRGQDRT
jgi:signal transduction histidine kinase